MTDTERITAAPPADVEQALVARPSGADSTPSEGRRTQEAALSAPHAPDQPSGGALRDTRTAAAPRRRTRLRLLVVVPLIPIAAAAGLWAAGLIGGDPGPQYDPDEERFQKHAAQKAPVDGEAAQALRRAMCGAWKRFSYGERILTLKPDGTGTLVYMPDSLERKIAIGRKLVIQIEWELCREGECFYVDFHSISGEPEMGYKIALQFDNQGKPDKRRRVQKVTGEEMVLFNEETDEEQRKVSVFERIDRLTD